MKNKNNFDVLIAIFLSVLVATIPVVFSALQPEVNLETQEVKQNSVIDDVALIFSKVLDFVDIVPNVAAEEPPPAVGCCEETLAGAKCQDGVISGNCVAEKWHENQECKDICLGCCINPNDGTCNSYSVKSSCAAQGSIFLLGDIKCEQSNLCKKGCCTIGYQKRWETNKTCVEQYRGSWDGSVPDWLTCQGGIGKDVMGCCVYNCLYNTLGECANGAGLSTQEIIRQGLWMQQKKCYESVSGCERCGTANNLGEGCIEGFPHVYKKDLCGNSYLEDIKTKCIDGQRCKEESGRAICEDVTCNAYDNWDNNQKKFTAEPGFHGKTRYEGESWCVYDMPLRTTPYAPIGSFDPVGSEHWLATCVDGEVIMDQSVYRQQICEEVLLDKDTGEVVMEGNAPMSRDKRYESDNYRSFASLTGNPWRVCILINDPEKCNAQNYCYWMNELNRVGTFLTTGELDGGPTLKGDMDPKGDLAGYGENSRTLSETDTRDADLGKVYAPIRCLPRVSPGFDENNKGLCNLFGTVQCTLLDRISGDSYPECDDAPWVELMAQRCRAVGDCGANINWVGEPSYEGFLAAEINPKKNASDNIIGKEIERVFNVSSDDNFKKFQASVEDKGIGYKLWLAGIGSPFFSGVSILANPATIVGVILLMIASFMPLGPGRSTIEALGYGLATYGLAYGLGLASIAGPAALVAVGIYMLFWFVWDVDHIFIKCGSWMPPLGSDDCEKCNEDPLRPCNAYRCSSLGAACGYKDSIEVGGKTYPLAEAVCIGEENDHTQPVIEEIAVKDDEGNSIYVNPNTNVGLPRTITIGQQLIAPKPLNFEVTFNEEVFCKWHNRHTDNISAMLMPFGGEDFGKIKREVLSANPLPSEQEIYLRCMDFHGNTNINEYIFNFDVQQQEDI
ncbi:MAG: hypothetical protein K6T73_07995, partial [Candidatus Bathyarchaeota archaeon]|nr:hypothetical protein [Candidatus Bathyarchaeota archaeon]